MVDCLIKNLLNSLWQLLPHLLIFGTVNSELHLFLCCCENEVTFSFCMVGSIRACKNAALKCEEVKFEHYKLAVGARLSADVTQHMENCLEKIKILEH